MRLRKLVFILSAICAPHLCLGQVGSNNESLFANFFHAENFSASVQSYYRSSRHQSLSGYNGSEVTTLSLHRSVGTSVLHYATTQALNEQHHYAGFSSGDATLALYTGKGSSFSQTGTALYRDLDHYFFHGGSRLPFRFYGAALDLGLSDGISAQVSATQLKAPGVEDRSGYYAGLAAGRVKSGFFGLQKGDDWVGHGLDFSIGGPGMNIAWQQIHSETGARVRRMGFSWQDRRRSRWSIDIEDARNPLYADGGEHRLMFRYQRALGRSISFGAAETTPTDEQEERKKSTEKWATIVGVGVGVGVIAAAVSSGDDGQDGAQRFASQNQAAFNVLNGINPVSVRENREHGGWIYRNADGSFGRTEPIAGQVASVNIGNPANMVPANTRATASYHTHGGPDPRFDNENFSPQDILSDIQAGVDGYLGTPAGFMKYHQLQTGRITTIRRIAN